MQISLSSLELVKGDVSTLIHQMELDLCQLKMMSVKNIKNMIHIQNIV